MNTFYGVYLFVHWDLLRKAEHLFATKTPRHEGGKAALLRRRVCREDVETVSYTSCAFPLPHIFQSFRFYAAQWKNLVLLSVLCDFVVSTPCMCSLANITKKGFLAFAAQNGKTIFTTKDTKGKASLLRRRVAGKALRR